MAKTKPIGVRFRPEVLEKLEKEHGVTSPQAALVFLERFYCQHWELTKDVTAPLRKLSKESAEKQKIQSQIRVQDLTQPTNVAKPHQQPKTNYSINTLPKETEAGKPPKTLDELKAMCPPELTGFDRSGWISDNRKKYNV